MADALQQNGKIYVVVAVLLIIFAGIIIFLMGMDKKISKLEKALEELSQKYGVSRERVRQIEVRAFESCKRK